MPLDDADVKKVVDALWDKIKAHEAWFVNKAQLGVQGELGDENVGEFSDRVAAKVAALIPTGGVDTGVLARAVAVELAARLARPAP